MENKIKSKLYLLKTNILRNPNICKKEKESLANDIFDIENDVNDMKELLSFIEQVSKWDEILSSDFLKLRAKKILKE